MPWSVSRCKTSLAAWGRTAAIIRQNLTFALGMMVLLVIGALWGELPLPLAVVGHEGGTVLVVLNGLRLLADPIRSGARG